MILLIELKKRRRIPQGHWLDVDKLQQLLCRGSNVYRKLVLSTLRHSLFVFVFAFLNLKTLEANVVKSLFVVLSKMSLKVLQCHRRQTKRFIVIFQHYFVPLVRPIVHVKFGADCVTNGRDIAEK